jgi:hypothetical protein
MLSTKNINQITIYDSVGHLVECQIVSYLSRKDFCQINGYLEQAIGQYLSD